jgi:peptidoglycan L-alanyl-D-glutamate endopeptidase CwlK
MLRGLVPALGLADKINERLNKNQEYELDENGKPKLDEKGFPIKKKKKGKGGLVGSILASGSGTISSDKPDILKAGGITLKTSREYLLDIYNILTQGILVFPFELNEANTPSHLKEMAKRGNLQNVSRGFQDAMMYGSATGTAKRKSLFGGFFDGGSTKTYQSGGGQTTYTPVSYSQPYQDSYSNQSYNSQNYGNQQNNYRSNQTEQTGQTDTSNENIAGLEVDKIKSPEQASLFFYKNANQVSNQLENMLYNGQYGQIEKLADNIEDPSSMGQNRSPESLAPEFGQRVKAFMSSPEAQAKGVKIREARRSPLTQLAYFTKGRASDVGFINEMFQKAGFSAAWDPHIQNTQTIGSKHFLGEAVDLEDHGKGESYYREIAPIAKKYGLAWGGDWPGWKDYPHFEMPRDDSDIGYTGPPKEEGIYPEITTQRADGYGNGFGKADIVSKNTTTSSAVSPHKQNDYFGTTTSTALHLKESPVITNDRELINQINDAINIQKAIHSEQRRHNTVAENFFMTLMTFLNETNKGSNTQESNKGGNNTQLSNLSAIMKAEQVAKEYFSANARTMALGY